MLRRGRKQELGPRTRLTKGQISGGSSKKGGRPPLGRQSGAGAGRKPPWFCVVRSFVADDDV